MEYRANQAKTYGFHHVRPTTCFPALPAPPARPKKVETPPDKDWIIPGDQPLTALMGRSDQGNGTTGPQQHFVGIFGLSFY